MVATTALSSADLAYDRTRHARQFDDGVEMTGLNHGLRHTIDRAAVGMLNDDATTARSNQFATRGPVAAHSGQNHCQQLSSEQFDGGTQRHVNGWTTSVLGRRFNQLDAHAVRRPPFQL